MRLLLSLGCVLLTACGGGEEPPAAPPTRRATAPAPRTPVMEVTPTAGNEAAWMAPRPAPDAPATAPYDNLLDQPVVKGPPAQ